ncbi:hypothetical protein HMPREF3099_10110 [Kytococcus sp. HMSC28H12]|nr:hypothetical protein HMPREF3099_10110 [Kytococcus sp. HMSC28H12]
MRGMATPPAMERLTRAFVDDAAIFPPGLSPLPDAVAQHRVWRTAPLGSRLGPLLLSVDAVAQLPQVLANSPATSDAAALPVGIAARPGTGTEAVTRAVATLRGLGEQVRLEVVERAADADWHTTADHGVDLALEAPRDPATLESLLDRLAASDRTGGPRVVAKWRTQASPAGPVPTPQELAGFITSCVERDVPFKLTGGLHHAVARTAPAQSGEGTEEMHGMLNVVVATHGALCGLGPDDVAAALAERDARAVADTVLALDSGAVEGVRAAWTSFGCCGVTDPLTEAAELGVLDPSTIASTPSHPTDEEPA